MEVADILIYDPRYLARVLGFPLETLRYYAENANGHYWPNPVTKSDWFGRQKTRDTLAPHAQLKQLQKAVNDRLLMPRLSKLPVNMMGGVKGRKTGDFTGIHERKRCIGKIDIRSCFDNITAAQVEKAWRTIGCNKDCARLLTGITTYEGHLPQGSPSSTMLCNFVLEPFFRQLECFADANGLQLGSWIDDFVISGDDAAVRKGVENAVTLLRMRGFSVRCKKVKVMHRGMQREVLGVSVTSRSGISRSKRNFLKGQIDQARIHGGSSVGGVSLATLEGRARLVRRYNKRAGDKLLQDIKPLI